MLLNMAIQDKKWQWQKIPQTQIWETVLTHYWQKGTFVPLFNL